MRGQFNLCIPVTAVQLDGTLTKKLFRCPLPHKVGGQHDGSNEKVRVDAANYAYVEANCPDIPIAGLVGFGFSDNHVRVMLRNIVTANANVQKFTHQQYLGNLDWIFF